MSAGVVIVTLGVMALFGLQIAGFASPYWWSFEQSLSVVSSSFHGGLFQICGSVSLAIYSTEQCWNYLDYTTTDLVDINYYGFVIFGGIGAILALAASIAGCAGCSSQNSRSALQNIAGISIGAGGCILASVVWFYVKWMSDTSNLKQLSTLLGLDLKLDYSFYLSAVSGGGFIVVGIVTCAVASNMSTTGGVVVPSQPTGIVVVSQQNPYPAAHVHGQQELKPMSTHYI